MSSSFADQFAAKAFFVDRIVARAAEEGALLSRAEVYQLNWTEVEPGFEFDPDMEAAFEAETDTEAFEAKIGGLMERAYRHDIETDSEPRGRYQAAWETLAGHDHYLTVMIDGAMGKTPTGQRKPWWAFWS